MTAPIVWHWGRGPMNRDDLLVAGMTHGRAKQRAEIERREGVAMPRPDGDLWQRLAHRDVLAHGPARTALTIRDWADRGRPIRQLERGAGRRFLDQAMASRRAARGTA